MVSQSIQVGSEYKMVKWDGDALAVDLTSGGRGACSAKSADACVWQLLDDMPGGQDGVYALRRSRKGHVITVLHAVGR